MIVLDTNVVSELFRPAPHPSVSRWLRSLDGEVALTSITVAELLAGVRCLPAGVRCLPDGRRKQKLSASIESAIAPYKRTRSILPFGDGSAAHFAEIVAMRRAAGAPISTADAQIAAICREHRAVCATRNSADFRLTGIEIIDPWEI